MTTRQTKYYSITKVMNHIEDKLDIQSYFPNDKSVLSLSSIEFYFKPCKVWTNERYNQKCITPIAASIYVSGMKAHLSCHELKKLFNGVIPIIQFNENKSRIIDDDLQFQSILIMAHMEHFNDIYYYPATTETVDDKTVKLLM